MVIAAFRIKDMTLHSEPIHHDSIRQNLAQLIGLRFLSLIAQGMMIGLAHILFGLNLALLPLISLLLGLSIFNIWCLYRLRSQANLFESELFLGLMVDVISFSALLYFTGGTSNPFIGLYLVSVIMGAVLLRGHYAWVIALSTFVFYGALSLITPYSAPLHAHALSPHMMHQSALHHSQGFDLHVHGMMLAYMLGAVLIVYFVGRIKVNLRNRDDQILRAHQVAIEQAQIIRMGLLSANAAHELGSPLTTVSVILKDWFDLSVPKNRKDQKSDLNIMLKQIDRCKSIISDSLSMAGVARGEGINSYPLSDYIHETIDKWQVMNPSTRVDLVIDHNDLIIAADKVMTQTITQILDNAREASGPDKPIMIKVSLTAKELIINIKDLGPGFDHSVLKRLGAPYLTTRTSAIVSEGDRDQTISSPQMRGLGLFLGHHHMRLMGGSLLANNDTAGGALVTLTFPLWAIDVKSGQ